MEHGATDATDAAQRLTLYHRQGCPYCARVERALRELNVDLTRHDVREDPSAKERLYAATGRHTVPVLRIEGEQTRWMPESRDIVIYLFERFGAGRRPGLRYGIVTPLSAALLLALAALAALAFLLWR